MVMNMSKWSDLYEEEISKTTIEAYVNEKLRTKKEIIKLIDKYVKNGSVLELGSGTGVLACKISSMGKSVIALDRDADMISLSKKYFEGYFKDCHITYINKDIIDFKSKDQIDVIYSIGILEHYNDAEIIKLLNKQLSMSDYVIFGIPTRYFDEKKKMYGNERYLRIRYWRVLIAKTNGELIEESHYHYLNWYQRIFKISKYFKPYPVHVFVLKRK